MSLTNYAHKPAKTTQSISRPSKPCWLYVGEFVLDGTGRLGVLRDFISFGW